MKVEELIENIRILAECVEQGAASVQREGYPSDAVAEFTTWFGVDAERLNELWSELADAIK